MAKRPANVAPGLTRKQLSRAKREQRGQRIILITTAVIAALVVILVGYAVLNATVLEPNKVLATVGDETITVREFQDRVYFESYLYQFSQFQFQPFNPVGVMDIMVEDEIIRQKAAEMDIEVTDEEVEEELQLQFGYDAGDPEPTSTPLPTDLPTSDASPTMTSTWVITPTPSPSPTLDPSITPTETEEATEEADSTEEAESTEEATEEAEETGTPEVTLTPFPTATPLTEEDYNTAVGDWVANAALATGLPEDRLRNVLLEWIRTNLMREELAESLDYEVSDTKTLVHAAHILVNTEEELVTIQERLAEGDEFEELAAELSIDTSNNMQGGDLGWFGEGRMVAAFEEVAFNTPVGEISDPVETEFGWHLIKVYDKVDEPTTFFEQEQQKSDQFGEMLEEWKTEIEPDIAEDYPNYVPAEVEQLQQQQPQIPGMP